MDHDPRWQNTCRMLLSNTKCNAIAQHTSLIGLASKETEEEREREGGKNVSALVDNEVEQATSQRYSTSKNLENGWTKRKQKEKVNFITANEWKLSYHSTVILASNNNGPYIFYVYSLGFRMSNFFIISFSLKLPVHGIFSILCFFFVCILKKTKSAQIFCNK